MKIPPQIVRILLLTVLIVGSYFTARAFLKPKSFGQFGHYRAEAMGEIAAREPIYAGMQACDECHSDVLLLHAKFEHKTVSCESCHGALLNHVNDPDHTTIIKQDDSLCIRCHLANPARPAFLKQVTPEKHYKGQPCIECHSPHQPNEPS
jgi:hypothetical protein